MKLLDIFSLSTQYYLLPSFPLSDRTGHACSRLSFAIFSMNPFHFNKTKRGVEGEDEEVIFFQLLLQFFLFISIPLL